MLIPLGTDRATRRKPLVTPALVAINVGVFALILLIARFGGADLEAMIDFGAFDTRRPGRVWTLITSMFLHDPTGISHLLFNMVFLWAFGCAVEDRLGRIGFLCFYLVGGVAAALGQWLLAAIQGDPSSMIGASGAVCAVTGGFAALFPRARIKIFSLFIILGVFWIPALFLVGLFFALDFIGQLTNFLNFGTSNTAFAAHLGGSVFGFTTAVILLATGLLKRDDFDIFFLFKQSRRRAAMRSAMKGTAAGPWESASADTGKRLEKARQRPPEPPREPEIIRTARADILRLTREHQPSEAAKRYASVLEEHPDFCMPADQQLDVASALFAEERFPQAAQAYENYLKRHRHDRRVTETALLLLVLYVRKMPAPEKARDLLERFGERFENDDHHDLVEALRSEVPA